MHSDSIIAKAAQRRLAERNDPKRIWQLYVNSFSHKEYVPHNRDEEIFVYDDEPKYMLLIGGEGGGKSTAGIIKVLNKLKRGMNCIMVSPDLPHFRKSLWSEFRLWCPWDRVIESQRYMGAESWEPSAAFKLMFHNEYGRQSSLRCGGIKEAEVKSWTGGNVNCALFDESHRHTTDEALKTLDGRCRIPGPKGEQPQLFMTTIPWDHWLLDRFGPAVENDPWETFKAKTFVGKLPTKLNSENLAEGYEEDRRTVLSPDEAAVYLDAEWGSIKQSDKFVNIIWWDNCQQALPALNKREPVVLALDASTGGEATEHPDNFSLIGVTKHPTNSDKVAVRYVQVWAPPAYGLLDYEPIEKEIIRLCTTYNVIEVAFDRYQLHDMTNRLHKKGVALFKSFGQTMDRLIADKGLLDLILKKGVVHDGNPILRKHMDNANKKKQGSGIRIVKSHHSKKVDLAVALSMAASRILYYNL